MCDEAALSLPSEALQHSARRNLDASLPAEAPRTSQKELLEIMTGGVTGTNGLVNFNVQPSKGDGFISRSNKMLYSIEVPNGSTNDKVLQLFPEKNIAGRVHLHSTCSSGLVPVVTSNNSSVTVALSHSSIGRQESIQYKLFEPSSSQELHELLLGSNRSWNRPQVGAKKGFRQNIQAFTNIWSESELDSLWVGVRRHGKDNWYAMLRDPKLRFSPCRTEMDLAKQWVIEQTKLLGSTPSPSCPYAKPVGIRMPPSFVPPGPGSMTRFLTEPPQFYLSNGYLNSQEMLPPRLPQNVTSGLGKGTRLLSQHVRAHRMSQNSENTWGRFKARDQVIPPQFPTPRASTSRNDILPSNVRGTFNNPHPQPPQPIPTLYLQHAGKSSEFHDEPNSKGIHIFKRNGISDSDCPGLALPSTRPGPANPTDPKRPKEIINLDSDTSF